MVESTDEGLREEVKLIKRRAAQQATAHSWLRDRYEVIQSVLTTFSLVVGVVLVATIMASPQLVGQTLGLTPFQWQWVTAALAAGSFSIVVVLLAWRFDVRAERHDQAVRRYTQTGYHSSRILGSPTGITAQEVDTLRAEYLDDRDLPRIPERWFLRLKKWHLEKVAVSRSLDNDPFESIPSIKNRLSPSSDPGRAGPSVNETVDSHRQ
jgi:hypothetical protein